MFLDFLKAVYKFVFGSSQTQQQQQQVPQQYQYPPPPQTVPGPYRPPKPHHQVPQQYQHSAPPQTVPGPPKPHHQDPNQLNQSDGHYTSLRDQANKQGDLMAQCFQESHEAYSQGNGALAKSLSNKGKEYQKKMEDLNRQASDWIFRKNNEDSAVDEVDLHGLYVKEAIARADGAIIQAKRDGRSELRLIVGKGLHSQGGIAKIRPAIEELMEKHHLKATVDPHNSGMLIVQIEASAGQRGLDAKEISRRIEKKEDCIIM